MSDFIPGTETRTRKTSHLPVKILAGAAIIACIAALAAIVVNVVFHAINTSFDDKPTANLSEHTVRTSLDQANIGAPDLSGYAYIDTANLIGPRFSDIVIGEPLESSAEAGKTEREVTFSASYRNNSVAVTVPVSQTYTHKSASNSWEASPVEWGAPQVTPAGAANVAAIEANLPALLQGFDPALASEMEGAVATLYPSLDASGGTISAKLSKTTEKEVLTCDVSMNVSWSGALGWNVIVTSASDIAHKEVKSTAQAMTLVCNEGDVVQLEGVIETGDGRTLLKTDAPIKVTMGEKTWTVERFELTTTNPDLSAEIGAHVTLQGPLTPTGTTTETPLAVSVTTII